MKYTTLFYTSECTGDTQIASLRYKLLNYYAKIMTVLKGKS